MKNKSQGTSKAVFKERFEVKIPPELYGLRPHNCILVNEADELRGYDLNPYIHLYPDETEKYGL